MDAGVRHVVGMKKLVPRRAGAPQYYALPVDFSFVKFADHGRQNEGSLKIKIVGRSIEIARHQAKIFCAMLPVVGIESLPTRYFWHGIGGVRLLQRATHKIFFANRLGTVTRIDAGRAQKQQLLDPVKVSLEEYFM